MRRGANRMWVRLGLTALGFYALASLGATWSWWTADPADDPLPGIRETSGAGLHGERGSDAAAMEPHPSAAPGNELSDATASGTRFTEPWIGFSINLHHTDSIEAYLEAIDQVAALGCTGLQIVTPAYQTDGAATKIERLIAPSRSATTEHITTLLARARQRGLRTALMPIVLFDRPRGNEWRGKIAVENWDAWWASYETVMGEFLDIAGQQRVDLFYVGSELISTETQDKRWRAWIGRCRERFGGLLSYSTNWDHYHWPTYWDALDAIAISGYWNVLALTDADEPDNALIAKRWREIRESVLAYAATQRRPVLISELGYPSLPWAMRDPWNYVARTDQTVDHAAQALGYASFLAAWDDLLTPASQPRGTGFAGVMFYHWDPYHHGGDADSGYGVRGKPAEGFLRRWLASRGPSTPHASTDASSTADGPLDVQR